MTANALIVGVGPGLSSAFARLLAREGFVVALASRSPDRARGLAAELGGTAHGCDATDPGQVAALFGQVPEPELVLYNPSGRVRGTIVELDPEAVRQALAVTAFGAFLVGSRPRVGCCRPGGAPSC